MNGPLDGIRVLEVGAFAAAPLCTMLLADLGADVVKVEPPGKGELYRTIPPFEGGESHYFMSVNRNKRGVALDLKHPESAEVARRLIEWADVLVQNYAPGVADALGVGYSAASAINPRLVYCSISGFGLTGPLAGQGGHDIILQASSGMMDATGPAGGEPVKVVPAVPDVMGATLAVVGILSALWARQSSGLGQHVDCSLFDAALFSLTPVYFPAYAAGGESPQRLGSEHPFIPTLRAWRGSDDRYLVTGAATDEMWQRMCAALDAPELGADARYITRSDRQANRAELHAALVERFATLPAAEWVDRLNAADVPSELVQTLGEAVESPQARARDMLIEVDHAVGALQMMGIPLKLSDTPGTVRLPPPRLGEHTHDVLAELGFSASEVDEMRTSGAIDS